MRNFFPKINNLGFSPILILLILTIFSVIGVNIYHSNYGQVLSATSVPSNLQYSLSMAHLPVIRPEGLVYSGVIRLQITGRDALKVSELIKNITLTDVNGKKTSINLKFSKSNVSGNITYIASFRLNGNISSIDFGAGVKNLKVGMSNKLGIRSPWVLKRSGNMIIGISKSINFDYKQNISNRLVTTHTCSSNNNCNVKIVISGKDSHSLIRVLKKYSYTDQDGNSFNSLDIPVKVQNSGMGYEVNFPFNLSWKKLSINTNNNLQEVFNYNFTLHPAAVAVGWRVNDTKNGIQRDIKPVELRLNSTLKLDVKTFEYFEDSLEIVVPKLSSFDDEEVISKLKKFGFRYTLHDVKGFNGKISKYEPLFQGVKPVVTEYPTYYSVEIPRIAEFKNIFLPAEVSDEVNLVGSSFGGNYITDNSRKLIYNPQDPTVTYGAISNGFFAAEKVTYREVRNKRFRDNYHELQSADFLFTLEGGSLVNRYLFEELTNSGIVVVSLDGKTRIVRPSSSYFDESNYRFSLIFKDFNLLKNGVRGFYLNLDSAVVFSFRDLPTTSRYNSSCFFGGSFFNTVGSNSREMKSFVRDRMSGCIWNGTWETDPNFSYADLNCVNCEQIKTYIRSQDKSLKK